MSDERNPRKKAGNNNIGRRASSKYSETPRNSENRNNGYYYKSISHNEPVQNRAQSKHYESSYIKKSQSRIQEPVRTQVPRRETASKNQGVKYTAKNFLRVGGIKIRRGALDYQFLLTTIILVAFGMIMLYSASSSRAYAATGDSMYFMKSQFGGLLVGIVAMIGCMMVDYHVIARLSPVLYAICIILLILVLIPGVGTTSNGATRWLFGFQPSEIVKFATLLVVAVYLEKYQDKLGNFFRGFLPCLLILGVVGALLMMEPHFSATILITLTTLLMMYVGGAKIRHFIILAIPAFIGGVAMIFAEPYRLQRLLSFGDPFADKQGAGWQIVQSLYAIGSGGVFGVGFGQSRQKYMSLPEPHNDFIFSVLSEELGWVGAIVVIVLFLFLIYRGIRIAQKAPDTLGKLIVIGCIGLIGFQAMINIGVVTASLPVTGMPLPFFSYGGTALAITMGEIGLVLNVSRQEKVL